MLAQGNVLLVIADDVGVDRVAAYREHPDPGNTPVIDSLAADGVLFRNAWASPLCSPSRHMILSGRYGFRTGVGTAIFDFHSWPGVGPGPSALPRVLSLAGYHAEVAGKWHLATAEQGSLHPIDAGFQHHRGSLHNLLDYFDWDKSVDGVLEPSTTYATTDTVDDAIQLVQTMPEPWFLWVAFNAPHAPTHRPPPELHSVDLSGSPLDHLLAVKAAIEALDTELGRLLAEVDEDTTVIFLGDNGTWDGATDAPFDPEHAKGTDYEGGLNVPLIVKGPAVAVPGSSCDALVSITDLFTTICDLAAAGPMPRTPGTAPPAFSAASLLPRDFLPWRDSVSLLPYLSDPSQPSLRDTVFADYFLPNGDGPYSLRHRAIRGPRYKLIEKLGGRDEFYDLTLDPFEQSDLLMEKPVPGDIQDEYNDLKARMAQLVSS